MNASTPKHLAIIMDGNGRWGHERGLTRSEGHYAGVQAMEKVIDASIHLGVEVLTLYAFSSENWSRPRDEVNYLMYLPIKFFERKISEFMERDLKIMVSGDLNKVPVKTRDAVNKAAEKTQDNNGMVVNFAFNYGGRDDILQAIRQVLREVEAEKLDIEQIDEDLFRHYLYTKELPDPNLIIRTGGEKRMSNFLLWQSSSADLYFTDAYFPDFDQALLEHAIAEVNMRNQSFEKII